jgi:2'-5' RNA ligase
MNPQRDFLSARYSQFWDGAIDFVRRGEINIDPLLARREPDRRRGLSVAARPSAELQHQVDAFLNHLRQIDPDQYYYHPAELHVTVLSLFTATVEFEKYLARYDLYLEAVNAAVSQAPSFWIEFTGVTLSRDAIMIQGYPDGPVLNDLREMLRKELIVRHLTEGLDGRYRLETAHMTVVRFRNPLRDSQAYTTALEKYRINAFGRTHIQELHFVRNDWYMSRPTVEVLQRYQLPSTPTPPETHPI